jgi:hypothetical protein
MRAREFIREQRDLPPETKEPLQNTFVLPGLTSSDPYKNYRFGVAIARARSDAATDDVDKFRPKWSTETPFGEHAVIVGFSNNVDPIIDAALKMTKTPGGKRLVSTAQSEEPAFVDKTSPVKPFKGYPR